MVGVGEDVAGAATLTAVPGTVMATTAMGIIAMAMVTMGTATVITGMSTVITGMAIRMDGPAGILPGHLIQADTPVGMPGQAEGLRVVNLAESDSLADTVGLWPQQDIRADPPPLGGVRLARRQRDTPRREPPREQAVGVQQEQPRPGHPKRSGLRQQGPHPRGLQQDAQADQPPPGGVNRVRRQRDPPLREQPLEQAV